MLISASVLFRYFFRYSSDKSQSDIKTPSEQYKTLRVFDSSSVISGMITPFS